ncbi:FAD-dependent oxidoreductase [Aquimarina sp. BL5]|uniref:flavin monoamine oxidase family protein n=1 Tax=Aquimarina sp. BL5 TaxID=1714860 RepID=UPI000E4AA7AD|nr:NAD(P)/FAD-dependent oxidoreductase [Aquimarina sp. BL5]AXT52826.1 FAD-dependent oxidoreductase [Aquimarina sp. BL5]RKN07762.1 FAD-binding protein [Aquimarina sp. BL5]
MKSKVLIIGAGLTGLLLAYRLKKNGIAVKVVEARNRIGGRIHTLHSKNETPIEMGATWLSAQHRELFALLEELGLPVFEQFMEGIALFEPLSTAPPQQIQLPTNQQPSYRIQGGTVSLIDKLAESLDKEELILNEKVTHIEYLKDQFEISATTQTYQAHKVISTLPPFLLVNSIKFTPELPKDIISVANKTHTWMGESIKFGISYERAFWKENNFSGTVFSNVGPITELYDHSNVENTRFALKGFLQSGMYMQTKEQRRTKVLSQLQKLFGTQALEYLAYEEVVWKQEPNTSIHSEKFIFPHQNNGHDYYQNVFFDNNFFIAGSETAIRHGGYMEGAIHSAQYIYQHLLEI